ncbi:hypothetical protein CP973_38945 [Streptomyces albofaciens JCM 4342]|uniref:hypothetical protein n=1 Tax=Streptomyces albofaciens TaxID=66866 RepID=UPI000AD992D0|nr:hypothetical protein [Streptomyces albofaciens]KAA6214988.1 hypothetical protein CP973_38945 [Streptomyces albofaciens JCM 4342]
MLHRRLPLLAVADVISSLDLNSRQVRRATTAMEHIVQRAFARRTSAKRHLKYEEFADAVPECHWTLMFEVCALIHLERFAEAYALTSAAQALHPSPAPTASPPLKHS